MLVPPILGYSVSRWSLGPVLLQDLLGFGGSRLPGCAALDRPAGRALFAALHRGLAMHPYRSHTCGALRAADAGITARLSGWVHSKRDHGGLLFIDLRDHYGLTQIVFAAGTPAFAEADAVRVESVITVTGQVVLREPGTVNEKLPTGEVELRAT